MVDKWAKRFLELADTVASWSKDPSTKVGAVIVDPYTNHVVGLGYNGFPRDVEDDYRLENRKIKYQMVIHAEENAIFNAVSNVNGCSIFITQPPCAPCTARLIQVGISSIYYYEPSVGLAERFSGSFTLSREMMKEAGVMYVPVTRGS